MMRVLVGIVLFVVGMAGLVLSFCGAMFMDYTSNHGGGPRQEYYLAMAVTAVGVLMVLGPIVYFVRRVRSRRAAAMHTGTIRSTDDLPG